MAGPIIRNHSVNVTIEVVHKKRNSMSALYNDLDKLHLSKHLIPWNASLLT